MTKRNFGAVRKLTSGRFQASYAARDGSRVNAPVTFDSNQDAEDWLSTVRADQVRGVLGKPKGHKETLNTYAAEWLEHRELRESSRFHYGTRLRLHILPKLGHLTLMEIDAIVVRRWHAGLSKTTGKGMQANAYRLLVSIMHTAVDEGLIPRNPCRLKGARNIKAKEREIVSAADLATVAGQMSRRYGNMFMVAAYCALRHGEVIGLRRKDVDLDAGTITIAEIISRIDGKWVVGEPKTEKSKRTIYVPPTVLRLLKAHLAEFTGPDPNARVFTTPKGNPVYASEMRLKMKAAGKAINRPDLFPHLLRHCGLTMIGQVGATGAEILARGGHTTMQIAARYQHDTDDRNRELAMRLDGLAA